MTGIATKVAALRESVRERAENRPGVYRMHGEGDQVLYVGKSIRVRTRLLSYFRAKKGEKAFDLVRETQRIEFDYIPNEFGALVREMRLIQRWRPPFNVQHKRKRPYAFVKLTREPAPRLLPVREVNGDGAQYYGPFPAVARLRDAARGLSQMLGLRDCAGATPIHFEDQTELFAIGRTPQCLRADLGTCLGPCAGRTSSVSYQRRVDTAKRFLEGDDLTPVEALRERMRAAAERKEFEYAATLRDRAEALLEFRDQLTTFRGFVNQLSFVYKIPGKDGEDRIYLIRQGRVQEDHPVPRNRAERDFTNQRVQEVYGAARLPLTALEPLVAAEILLVAKWFRLNPAERGRTIKAERWLQPTRPLPGRRRSGHDGGRQTLYVGNRR